MNIQNKKEIFDTIVDKALNNDIGDLVDQDDKQIALDILEKIKNKIFFLNSMSRDRFRCAIEAESKRRSKSGKNLTPVENALFSTSLKEIRSLLSRMSIAQLLYLKMLLETRRDN